MKRTTGDEKVINILSLDAGSIAGVLSQMHVLAEIMDRLGKLQGQGVEGVEGSERVGDEADLLPSNHFDVIGASGIAALAALCIGPLKMSVKDTIEALKVLGLSVFYENRAQSRYDSRRDESRTTATTTTTIFDSNELREAVRNLIENAGFSPDAMIGTFDSKSRCKTVFFVSPIIDISSCHRLRTYRGRKGMLQCTILQVALACVSTVGLFEHAEIGSNRRKYTSVGMYHTNPVKEVLDEAEQIFGKERRVACLLSLGAAGAGTGGSGSGSESGTIMPFNLAHLEVHGLLQAMEMQQKVITEEAGRQFGSLEAYFRYSVPGPGVGSGSLGNWMNWDPEVVKRRSREYLEHLESLGHLDAIRDSVGVGCAVEQLAGGRGSVTLNRLNHATDITVTAKPVPPVTPFFVLRKKAWSFIKRNLVEAPQDTQDTQNQNIFLLSGMGGCGKSTLFSYYVEVYGSRYSNIFFIDASSAQSIKTDLQNAVRSLGPEHSQKTWEEAIQYFEQDQSQSQSQSNSGNNSGKSWLIGFDSADDPSIHLPDYIPKSTHGTIFISSRNRDLCFLTSVNLHWELGPMTEEESLDALLRAARLVRPDRLDGIGGRDRSDMGDGGDGLDEVLSEDDRRDGTTLVRRLGGLALAVVQAGVYCFQKCGLIRSKNNKSEDGQGQKTTYTLRNYLDEMDSHQSELMSQSFTHSLDGYNKSVYQTLNMSYTALPQLTRDFLHLCGFFHHSNIPLLMLESAVDAGYKLTTGVVRPEPDPVMEQKLAGILEPSTPGKSTTIHLHKIVFSLKMFSFVVTSMTPHTVMLSYHALVNTWSRDILSPSLQQLYAAMAAKVVSVAQEDKYYRVHASLIPHVREILKRNKYPKSTLHLNEMLAFASSLSENGMAEEAEIVYRQMYDRCMKEYSWDHPATLMALGNIGSAIRKQGRYAEAEEIEREVLEGQSMIYPPGHRLLFITTNGLAHTYMAQDKWKEAEALLAPMLAQGRWMLGNEHSDTLSTMHNLSIVYSRQLRNQEAITLLEEVIETRKRVLGKDHPHISRSMDDLAGIYSYLKRYEEAQKLQEKVLEMMKEMLGESHPDTLLAMNNLAGTYQGQKRYEEALDMASQALEGRKRVLGMRHPDTWQTMALVASIYFTINRMEEGRRIQEELAELEGWDGRYSQALRDGLRGAGESEKAPRR